MVATDVGEESTTGYHYGANISMLSQFAAEREILFPPCTMLQVINTDEVREQMVNGTRRCVVVSKAAEGGGEEILAEDIVSMDSFVKDSTKRTMLKWAVSDSEGDSMRAAANISGILSKRKAEDGKAAEEQDVKTFLLVRVVPTFV